MKHYKKNDNISSNNKTKHLSIAHNISAFHFLLLLLVALLLWPGCCTVSGFHLSANPAKTTVITTTVMPNTKAIAATAAAATSVGLPLSSSSSSSKLSNHAGPGDSERQPLLSSSETANTSSTSSNLSVVDSTDDTVRHSKNRFLDCLSQANIVLLFYFALFYAGNYGYSVANKLAVQEAMFPFTIATMNFGLGCLAYVPFLWASRWRPVPWNLSWQHDLPRLLPVALFTAGSHTASVYGYAHGSVSFVNIVKTAEPVFCALLSQFGGYGQRVSVGKWCTLPIIVAGVVLASKSEYLFSWTALWSACLANVIAAIRSNETKALLDAPGLQERLQGAGNQFAMTALLGFVLLLPCAVVIEGRHYDQLWHQLRTSTALRHHIGLASFYFYGYNELRTLTLKRTSAVTGSIANTLKRVLIVIVVAIVLGEHLTIPKLLGCLIAITGVLLYSTIDLILPPRPNKTINQGRGGGGKETSSLTRSSDSNNTGFDSTTASSTITATATTTYNAPPPV